MIYYIILKYLFAAIIFKLKFAHLGGANFVWTYWTNPRVGTMVYAFYIRHSRNYWTHPRVGTIIDYRIVVEDSEKKINGETRKWR